MFWYFIYSVKENEIFCKLLLLQLDTKYLDNKTTTIEREALRQAGNISPIKTKPYIYSVSLFITRDICIESGDLFLYNSQP